MLFKVVVLYKDTENTKLVNPEPLFIGVSCEPLVTIFLLTSEYITLFTSVSV